MNIETQMHARTQRSDDVRSPHVLTLNINFLNFLHFLNFQVLKPVEKPEDRLSFENPNPFIQEKDEEKVQICPRMIKWVIACALFD